MKTEKTFPYPLCVQLWETDFDAPQFEEMLCYLQEERIYGVELNITDFSAGAVNRVLDLLSKHHLALTSIATGVWAKRNRYALCSPDEKIRRASVDAFAETILPCAKKYGADVIVGTLKGGNEADRTAAQESLLRSLEEINNVNMTYQVPVYLEATNRYESPVINTLHDAAEIIDRLHAKNNYFVLPDTFHMNIEEKDMAGSLRECAAYFSNVHFSDSNRYFPGRGHLPFEEICSALREAGYAGRVTIEGIHMEDFEQDLRQMKQCLQRAISESR